MKILIVGGVAGGASCAARLRRLDEHAEIVMVERGPYVSYASCGLPYHVGGVIAEESKLLVASERLFREQFAIDVRTRCEAIAIDRERRCVELRDVEGGETTVERYDALVLAPGAAPIRPPLPGVDLPGVFVVRSVPDARSIREWIAGGAGASSRRGDQPDSGAARRAVVVGGGFIGLEMAENLVHLGFEVAVVERLPQVLSPLDREVAALVEGHLRRHGVTLLLQDGAAGFAPRVGGGLEVLTSAGRSLPAEIVILALGVRPETALAKSAGLRIGELGGIRVDEQMRTSDPSIYAVGDAVEVKDVVTGRWGLVALAGPANRQGRIAAEAIVGRGSRFRGSQGTSIIGLFGGAAAWTGANERTLAALGDADHEKVYLFPNSHAGYYPGATKVAMKLLFRRSNGRLLGAQAFGEDGPSVDKRVSALSVAIQMGATVEDLEEAELCYAPQFGSAKDPVNFSGMIAGNALRGDMPLAHWGAAGGSVLLDVREPEELVAEPLPGAVGIPLGALRSRLGELPHDQEILVVCRSGQRAYVATRVLLQHGFRARTISGGMLARAMTQAE